MYLAKSTQYEKMDIISVASHNIPKIGTSIKGRSEDFPFPNLFISPLFSAEVVQRFYTLSVLQFSLVGMQNGIHTLKGSLITTPDCIKHLL